LYLLGVVTGVDLPAHIPQNVTNGLDHFAVVFYRSLISELASFALALLKINASRT